jgi:hypothetical protein
MFYLSLIDSDIFNLKIISPQTWDVKCEQAETNSNLHVCLLL